MLTLTDTRFYQLEGFYYAISGRKLVQFQSDYFLTIQPGNEFYGYLIRKLTKTKPIPQSEGEAILSELQTTIKELL